MREKGCVYLIAILIVAFGLTCVGALIFMLLWNWLVPIFWSTCPILTFWQSLGVLLILDLIGLFFRGSSSS